MTCSSCQLSNSFGKKRKVNPEAKRAMQLVYSEGISLKEAWKRVKSGKVSKRKSKKSKKSKSKKSRRSRRA